jgi:hypothetical protein
MSDFSNPESSASVSFRPNGIYYGIVTNVDEEISRVWVLVPRISVEVEYGPLAVSSLVLPREGERVACVFVENRADSLVVLGVVRSSTSFTFAPPVVCTSATRPDAGDIPPGTTIFETDTFLTYVWNGTTFGGISSGGDFSSAGTFINSFGVGIGVVSPQMPFYASRSHLPISLAGANSGQAVFGLTSGANVALGSVTGAVALTAVDTIQARVGTAAGVLKVNPLGGAVQFGGAVSAPSFAGNLNATQLVSGTVPAARLAGAYTGITQLGSAGGALTVNGTLTVNGGVLVNGGLNATALDAADVLFGKLPAQVLSGQNYSVANLTATNAVDTPVHVNYGGPIYLRPNNNDGREFVVSNGDPGTLSTPTTGHRLKGRLTLMSSFGERCGLWFANINNANYPHFLGRNVADNGVRFFSSEVGIDSLTISDAGLIFPYAPSGSGTQLSRSIFGTMCLEGSSLSLKDNIADIENPWEIIDSIRPRSFTWKPPADASELVSDLHTLGVQYGFVVEELIEDAPRLVQYNANKETPEDVTTFEPISYDNRHLISLTVAAVQDLKAQITALEARIESLEA